MCVGAGYLALVEVAVIEPTRSWQRTLALLEHRNHQQLHLRRRSHSRVQRRRGADGEEEKEEGAPLTSRTRSLVCSYTPTQGGSVSSQQRLWQTATVPGCVRDRVSERATSERVGEWGSV